MQAERIRQLENFLKEDPNDPFNLYALATEYLKQDPAKAMSFYEKLLQEHPEYVPTYYHAAALYAALGQNNKAEATYQKGIATAQKVGDAHALRELQSAYNNWQFEQEE